MGGTSDADWDQAESISEQVAKLGFALDDLLVLQSEQLVRLMSLKHTAGQDLEPVVEELAAVTAWRTCVSVARASRALGDPTEDFLLAMQAGLSTVEAEERAVLTAKIRRRAMLLAKAFVGYKSMEFAGDLFDRGFDAFTPENETAPAPLHFADGLYAVLLSDLRDGRRKGGFYSGVSRTLSADQAWLCYGREFEVRRGVDSGDGPFGTLYTYSADAADGLILLIAAGPPETRRQSLSVTGTSIYSIERAPRRDAQGRLDALMEVARGHGLRVAWVEIDRTGRATRGNDYTVGRVRRFHE